MQKSSYMIEFWLVWWFQVIYCDRSVCFFFFLDLDFVLIYLFFEHVYKKIPEEYSYIEKRKFLFNIENQE